MYLLGFSNELMSLAFTLLSCQWLLTGKAECFHRLKSTNELCSSDRHVQALGSTTMEGWELDLPAAVHAGRAGMSAFRMNCNQWETRWNRHTHFLSTPPFQVLFTITVLLCSRLPYSQVTSSVSSWSSGQPKCASPGIGFPSSRTELPFFLIFAALSSIESI